jgi:hypothetical protein
MDPILIRVGDEILTLTTSNSRLYRFRDRPDFDHIYVEEADRNYFIFEAEELYLQFQRRGVVIIDNLPTQSDEDAYVRYVTQSMEADIDGL